MKVLCERFFPPNPLIEISNSTDHEMRTSWQKRIILTFNRQCNFRFKLQVENTTQANR